MGIGIRKPCIEQEWGSNICGNTLNPRTATDLYLKVYTYSISTTVTACKMYCKYYHLTENI